MDTDSILQSINKNKKLMVFLIIIVCANLIISLFIFDKMNSIDLPDKAKRLNVEASVIKNIAGDIKKYYNNRDYNKLYKILGEYAQSQVTFQDFKNQIIKLDIFGEIKKIEDYRIEYSQAELNYNWYHVIFSAEFTNGKGEILITIRAEKETQNFEVVGYRFYLINPKKK